MKYLIPAHMPAKIPAVRICSLVEARYGLKPGTLRHSRTKERAIAQPRQIAMYLIRERTWASFHDIGRLFRMHYTTVIHSVRKVAESREEQESLANFLRDLNGEIDGIAPLRIVGEGPDVFRVPERASVRELMREVRSA